MTPPREGTALNNIGGVHLSQGSYGQAINYYQQSLDISRKVGDRSGGGTALDHYQQAKVIFGGIGAKALEEPVLANIQSLQDGSISSP